MQVITTPLGLLAIETEPVTGPVIAGKGELLVIVNTGEYQLTVAFKHIHHVMMPETQYAFGPFATDTEASFPHGHDGLQAALISPAALTP